MTERAIWLDGHDAPIGMRDAEGVPTSAQADEARVLLAGHARPEPNSRVLDLCCGTGLCAIAAGRAEPSAEVLAVDVDYRLCAITSSHAERNGVSNVVIEHGDGFDHLSADAFDAICLYPPAHCSATTVKKLIAEAAVRLRDKGRLWLATQKRLGGKAYQRWAEELFGPGTSLARRRGCEVSLYVKAEADLSVAGKAAEELAEQERHSFETTVHGLRLRFRTKLNVFSWSGLDRGTELLLQALPEPGARRILDLGCGYGPIGIVAARLYEGAEVTMSDVDRRALDLASINAAENGCAGTEVCASDGVEGLRGGQYDLILSNLPTHVGKQRTLALLRGVHDRLSPGGRLVAVISSELTVDRVAREIFGNAATLAERSSHRVFQCRKSGVAAEGQ
jgi:16S rRNA (guanine1207-N2)-methyltransferase